MVGIEPKLGLCHKVAAGVVGQHGFGPGRDPCHGAAKQTGGGGDHDIFRVGHRLHAKAAADIRVGHANPVTREAQHAGKFVALGPDALTVDAQMQAVVGPFGKGGAGFHWCGGDPVVNDRHRDPVG